MKDIRSFFLQSRIVLMAILCPLLLSGQNATKTALNRTFIHENKGQSNGGALYIASSPAGKVMFYKDHIVVYQAIPGNTKKAPVEQSSVQSSDRLSDRSQNFHFSTKTIKLPGLSKATEIIPGKKASGFTNFFIGKDSSRWITNLPNYHELTYQDKLSGYTYTFSCKDSDLTARESGPSKTGITTNPLLLSASYIGGASGDFIHDIKVDELGNIYLCGETYSQDFPVTSGAYDTVIATNSFDGFVMKFDSTGNNLIFSTFIGGGHSEELVKISVKPVTHEVVVSGNTNSVNFPVTPSAFQAVMPGNQAACVFGLSNQGNMLVFSSYLGGPDVTILRDMFVNDAGEIYLSGNTKNGFPTTAGSYQPFYGGDEYDMFLSKFNPIASSFIFSTYLGGANRDFGASLAVDSAGFCYLGCLTEGGVPITPQAFQPTLLGSHDFYVCKLTPAGDLMVFGTYYGLNTAEDRLTALAVDKKGVVGIGITGNGVFSTTPGAYTNGPVTSFLQKGPVSLFKLSNNGDSLRFATLIYYGSGLAWTSNDSRYGPSLCLHDDMIFFAYYTYPATFGWTPERGTICAFDSVAPVLAGSCKTALFALSADASKLLYLSYYGANYYTASPALTLRNNMAYLAGVSNSTDLPMTSASYDTTFGSALGGFNGDGYYARLKIEIYPVAGFDFPAQVCRDSAVYFQNLSHCSKSFSWDFGDGDTSSLSSPSHIYDTAGTYTITLIAYNDAGNDTLQKSILVQYYNQQFYDTICEGDSIFLAGGYRYLTGIYTDTLQSTAGCDSIVHTSLVVNPTPMVDLPADTLFCAGKSVELDAGNPGSTYLWSTGDTVRVLNITAPGIYTLTVTSGSACDMYGESVVTEIPLPYSTLTESAILCKGEVLILETDTCPDCQYLWSTGSTQSSISVSDSGTYTVKIFNSHCEITDTSHIAECARLTMPNVFTPNADGYNDFFIPDYANVDSFELTIYNRWGKLIAKSGDLRTGWDGNSNNTPCPDGTYYFLVEFSGPGKGAQMTKGSLKGTLTLLR